MVTPYCGLIILRCATRAYRPSPYVSRGGGCEWMCGGGGADTMVWGRSSGQWGFVVPRLPGGDLLPSFLARGSRAGPSVRGRAARSAAGRRPPEASLDGLSPDLPVAHVRGDPGGEPGSRLPHLEQTIWLRFRRYGVEIKY